MSVGSNDKVAATFHPNVDPVRSDLQRRRELAAMKKPALINIIRKLEIGIDQLVDRIDTYRDEP